MEQLEMWREVVESLAWEYAGRIVHEGQPALVAMDAGMQHAFSALGWENPHPVEEREVCCELEGCMEWWRVGPVRWPDGSADRLYLCEGHAAQMWRWMQETGVGNTSPPPCPPLKWWAKQKQDINA